MKNPWRTLSQKVVYATRFGFRLREDAVIDPSGQLSTYTVLEGGDFLTIVGITKTREIIFVHQWRYPLERMLLELPAGHLEAEDPLTAAKREFSEEVGGHSAHWSLIVALWACVGATKTRNYIFLATDVDLDHEPHLDPNESLEVRLIPYHQALSFAASGKFEDEKTVAALFLADHYLRTHATDS